jgi:hypothetical protein
VSGGFNRHAGVLTNLARGRQIVFQASRAFNLAGAWGFRWFRRQNVDAIDEDQVRVEFLAWLKEVDDAEITRFIEAMGAYRHALKEEVDSDPPQMGPTERGAVLRGDSGRIAWRKIQKLAGIAATETQGKARSADGGGLARANERAKTDGAVLSAARALLAGRKVPPSRWWAAGEIAVQVNRSQKHVDTILARLAGDIANGLPSEWIPREGASARKRVK